MLRAVIERPVSVMIGTLTLVMIGFFSLLKLPVSLLPTLERPRLVVTVRDADRSREDLARNVVEPLERRLLSLPGVLEIHGTIEDGRCRLALDTEWQTDVDRLRIDAERRLAEVTGLGLDELVVRLEAGDREPILQIAVFGGRSAAERTIFADKVLIPELGRLPGAGRLERVGGASRRAVVRPRAAALAARGLTAEDLVTRLREIGRTQPAGSLRDGGQVRPLVLREAATSTAELGARRLPGAGEDGAGADPGPSLREVADVRLEEVPDASIFRIDSWDGVLVEVHRAPGANAVLLARAARKVVDELDDRGLASGGPRLEILRDASEEVVDALTNLALAAFCGLLLGTVVLRWMLGSWRPTLALSVVVPASIVAAFGAFYLWDVSLDIVSLAGLALAAGMLVDNSIVVLEAIASARARREADGEASTDSASVADGASMADDADPVVDGTRQIALALVASFLTTAVAFLPLIYLQGLARAFFGVQAFAIVTSLAVSLVLSLSLTPVLAGRPSLRGRPARAVGMGQEVERRSLRLLGALAGRAKPSKANAGRSPGRSLYLRWLDRALARPWLVIAATVVLLAVVASLVPSLRRELVPPGSSRTLRVELELPEGLDREAALERLERLEAGAPRAGRVSTILRRHDPLRRDSAEDSGQAEIELELSPAARLPRTHARLAETLASQPGVRGEIMVRRGAVAAAVERSARRLEIEVSAATQPRAEELARRVEEAISAAAPGAELRPASFRSRGRPRPSIVLEWDAWRLAQLDADPARLSGQVRSALGGFYAGRLDAEGVEPEILVEATSPGELRLLPVRPGATPASDDSRSGNAPQVLPLEALANVEQRLRPPPLERRDGRPALRLELVGVSGRSATLGPARLEEILATVPLALDERVRLVGQVHELRRSFGQLRLALALALVLVFLTVAALYESLTLPLVVMTTVPVAAAGALGTLMLSGQSLNVMSFLGIILLAGIVVNNAIVLVHRIEQLGAAGRRALDAVREAAGERYRPILMTTLTTLLGMAPLAALGGQGVELRRALAVAVAGGLVTALFATLFVVPVLHRALVRRPPGGEPGLT